MSSVRENLGSMRCAYSGWLLWSAQKPPVATRRGLHRSFCSIGTGFCSCRTSSARPKSHKEKKKEKKAESSPAKEGRR